MKKLFKRLFYYYLCSRIHAAIHVLRGRPLIYKIKTTQPFIIPKMSHLHIMDVTCPQVYHDVLVTNITDIKESIIQEMKQGLH